MSKITAYVDSLTKQEVDSYYLTDVYKAWVYLDAWKRREPELIEVWVIYGVPEHMKSSHKAAFGRHADPCPGWCSWDIMEYGIDWTKIPGSIDREFRQTCAREILDACERFRK